MSLSTRLAGESELIFTEVIMVPLFPYMAVRHAVDNTPTTVINGGQGRIVGPVGEDEYVDRVLSAPPLPEVPDAHGR